MALSVLLCAPGLQAATKAIEITSVDQFNKLYNSDKPMITMYSATWCGPCKATKPHFKKLAEQRPDVTFAIVDTDKLASLAKGIRGIPTFKFSKLGKPASFSSNGKTISAFAGGRKFSELEKLVNDFASCPKK